MKHKFQRHLRLHEAERRFVCPVPLCGRAFLQREFLARHALTHSGDTPFACPTCGKAFNQLVNLRQHQERVHRAEGRELRHECGVCDKVSLTSGILLFKGELGIRVSMFQCFVSELTFCKRPSLARERRT